MKEFWNARYREEGCAYGVAPNAFLAAQSARLKPDMHALVVGDGEGRNGVWLAKQGVHVTTVDYAEAAVEKARQLARQQGVALSAICVDLTRWQWPHAQYDVVASIFVHFAPAQRQAVHAAMWGALKPGGMLILEAFTPAQLGYASGGPRQEDMLFTAQMLRADFAEGDILLLEETVAELDEGKYHCGRAALVRLLLRKP